MGSIPAFITFLLIILTNIGLLYYYAPSRLPPYDPPQYGLSLVRPVHRKFKSEAVEEFLMNAQSDIPAMWIRDSSNQIAPYIRFIKKDTKLKDLVFGVIQVQASYLDYDPYANAFLRPWYAPPAQDQQKGSISDIVTPAYDPSIVWESKDWINAVLRVFQVIRDQMKDTWPSVPTSLSTQSNPDRVSIENRYRFRRYTDRPTETLGESGLGGIAKECGLVKSAFRPSDDATTLPYLIPANAQLSVQLLKISRNIRDYMKEADQVPLHHEIALFAEQTGETIKAAIEKYGIVNHPLFGQVYAYEVDCFGSHIIMDDANLPSLLSLPVLGFVKKEDRIYQNTRRLVLSDWNPWYFKGSFIQGIGGPHTGENMVWPMSLLMQIQTSNNESEIRQVIDMVKRVAKRTNNLMYQSTQLGNDSHLLEVRLPSPPSEHFKELTIARETKLTPVDRRIPKIVHFVYGLRDPEPTLDLIHYIAIKSAHDTLKPEKIMFHYHHLPVGENFERARPMLTLNKVPLVEKVFGRPVSHYAHRADVVRLQVLEEFGGIYLDLDLISLKPVDHLLNREFIMAQEGVDGSVGLCNAMIMARPHSRFIQRWFATYATFDSADWNYHSVILPGKLAPFFPNEVTVLNHSAYFWPLWDSQGLRTLYLEKSYDFSANLGTHIWESAANKNLMKDVNEKVIMQIDNSLYCRIRPFLLDGKPDPRPNSCRILTHTEREDKLVGYWSLKEPASRSRKDINPLPAEDNSGNNQAGIMRNAKYVHDGVYLSGDASYIFLNLPTLTSAHTLTVSWWMKTIDRPGNDKMAMVIQTDHGRICAYTHPLKKGKTSISVKAIKRNDKWAWADIPDKQLRPSPYAVDKEYHHYALVIDYSVTKESKPTIALYMDGHVVVSKSDWQFPEEIGSVVRGLWFGSIEPLNDRYQNPWDNTVNLKATYRDIHVWEKGLSSEEIFELYHKQ
ncbi:hypothetical protein G6F64_002004 [Rhizopus arrhizus]|uniref:Uncharacterized protein n=1 Tax=Rhizopus oryzae TaxID=64495 RepID=A0A9P6XH08_RHIOR|nr:hypothetical protein G6F64_002004 [Rhizopus arrhizus]